MQKTVVSVFLLILCTIFCAAAESNCSDSMPLVFSVGEHDELTCVITGFDPADAETVQSVVRNAEYTVSYEIPSMTDAEKNDAPLTDDEEEVNPDGDTEMCWAGSVSDMLWYSGWAANTVNPDTNLPFADEDEVFDFFRSRFTNDGAGQDVGLQWFFNGINTGENTERGGALLRNGRSAADGFYKDIPVDSILTVYDTEKSGLEPFERLKDGDAIGIGIPGHAVTVVGYICDPVQVGTAQYYTAIILSDSDDSAKDCDTPAAQRPNTITVYRLDAAYFEEDGYWTWALDRYPNWEYHDMVITDIYVLKKYDSALVTSACETNAQATKDAQTTPDIVPGCAFTFDEYRDDPGNVSPYFAVTTFAYGQDVYLEILYENRSYAPCAEAYALRVRVESEAGDVRADFCVRRDSPNDAVLSECLAAVRLNDYADLTPGTYTVTVELNSADTDIPRAAEAYYRNNAPMTCAFTVTEP